MANANMTFKANLLPNSNLGYSLGSSEQKWTVYGSFKGNADTATALTSNAGSSTVPIYFSGGKPVQCSTTLGVSITGTAATATALTSSAGSSTQPIYFSNGKPTSTSYSLSSSINSGTKYLMPRYNANTTIGSSGICQVDNISYSTVTPDYTNGGEQFYKAWLKYVCNNYPNADLHIGTSNPNSKGPIIGNIYDVTDKDSTTGLPRYSTFIFNNLGANLEVFGTSNCNYWHRNILTDNNYTSYTVTKTGSGASGSWGISITGSSASCTGNAASATKLQTARTIWGQSFNGTANISGSFTGAGPQLYLPSGQTNFQFLTSSGGAGSGKFGRLLLSDNYSQGDISSYRLDVYGGSARVYNGYLYITANSNTVTIGSQNTSFCHITNSADIPFWFNKEVQSAVAFKIYDSSTRMSDGSVTIRSKSNPSGNSRGHGISLWEDGEGGNITIYTGNCGTYGSWQWDIDAFNGDLRFFSWDSSGNYHGTIVIDKSTGVLHGACWNDYAEFRETCVEAKPGQCVIENGDDTLSLSTKRCQPGAQIVSDTYGFAIGKIEGKYETPLAVSGRVLAYTDVDRYKFKPGQAVCSGKNGTVSRMRWYEKILWPERIIGFVSAIPEYEEWGNINAEVKVNSRIWIKVK